MTSKPQSSRRWVAGCLAFVGVMGAAVGGAWQVWHYFTRPVGSQDPIRVDIEPGSTSRSIGHQLADAGVIRSGRAWQLWTRTLGRGWVFQAGVYDLDPGLSMVEVAAQLRTGQTVQVAITIPEGWRIAQMAEAVAAKGWMSAPTFEEAAGSIYRLRTVPWIPAESPSLEGYLFPDTYYLPLSTLEDEIPPFQKAEALIRAMLDQFEAVAIPMYEANQASDMATPLSLHEWVTLASIVEKESVVDEERRLIAGVFSNRLAQRIPLGADPTVEYALDIRQTPDRRLTWAEVETPSPYNTYVNAGLPPGAIASPGSLSLQATLDPEQTEFLYFVARYDGTHVFSRTLDEHLAAQRDIVNNLPAAGSN